MSDSVDRVFAHALQTVRKIPKTGGSRPPADDRLRLYGLYKQSMEGDVKGVMDRPTNYGLESRDEIEKWDAWNAQSGLSRTEAKRLYIATLIETMHRYASATPEARGLVAELEFVWDQIRSNQSSQSAVSPSHRTYYPPELGIVSPNPFGEEEDEDSGIDADHRKWRRRVEQALAKMATEVTALRERMEDDAAFRRRGRLRGWFWWALGVMGRHLVVEMVFWGLLWMWMQKRGDLEAVQALTSVVGWGKSRVREVGNWRKWVR
ncbi:acyl CoA binding protein-domain-containing protein [Morchella snyderi]|nr:acyl CoA binding protein-domain-containing protein [Morchella snyderi]